MVHKDDVLAHFYAIREVCREALSDVRLHLDYHFRNVAPTEVTRIYVKGRISDRVKPPDSIWRKCERDGLVFNSVDEAPSVLVDLLGIRISLPDKEVARNLFRYFQSIEGNWFCPIFEEPKFKALTVQDDNRYAIETGYQGYHVLFVFSKSYYPAAENKEWGVEIQIMSKLWEFWAEYSREHFYGEPGPATEALRPDLVEISRILDGADDLIVTTTRKLEAGAER